VRLELKCYEAGKQLPQMVARTLNVSRNGALLLWNPAGTTRVPRPGELLDVDLEIPPGAHSQKCIRCRGQVIRVHIPENQPARVAMSIAQMTFVGRGRRLRSRPPGTAAPAKEPGSESGKASGARAAGQEVMSGWIS
jgi:hypothetical protein